MRVKSRLTSLLVAFALLLAFAVPVSAVPSQPLPTYNCTWTFSYTGPALTPEELAAVQVDFPTFPVLASVTAQFQSDISTSVVEGDLTVTIACSPPA